MMSDQSIGEVRSVRELRLMVRGPNQEHLNPQGLLNRVLKGHLSVVAKVNDTLIIDVV